MEVLDVGCGNLPRGDVNTDVGRAKGVPNFVQADAHYLPFRDKVFKKVVSFSVIATLYAPLQAIKEMSRVCGGKVYLLTPSQFCLDRDSHRIYVWNPLALEHLLKLIFAKVRIGYTSRYPIITGRLRRYLPLLRLILSKLGFHPHVYAVCEKEEMERLEVHSARARAGQAFPQRQRS